MFHLHKTDCVHCDHVMANVGEALSYAQDLLQLPREDRAVIAKSLRPLLIDPFLESSRSRVEFWTKPEIATNWKIMTCGDTGSAICAFAEFYADTPELLAMAIRGVIETLDAVPPEGDWYEGPSYWFGTLNFGLRMMLAIQRRSGGAIDFFSHPALRKTGDFAGHMITPGGRYYAWFDNFARLEHVDNTLKGKGNAGSGKALTILARMADRPDWRYLAAKFPNKDLFVLAFDEPDKPTAVPDLKVGWFPKSGVLTMRTGWTPNDAYVGPALRTGHDLGPCAPGYWFLYY